MRDRSEIRGAGARRVWPIVAVCFWLSGFAALLYQVVWLRQFGILFGTSELALVATLASYMAGLGTGAFLAQQFVHRVTRPLRIYVLLELSIAASALALPRVIPLIEGALPGVASFRGPAVIEPGAAIAAASFLTAFLLMMLPTAMMGATLPVLLKFVLESDEQIGDRTSLLYGVNTAGAVVGVLVTAFLLLPNTGLQQATWVGVLINLLAATMAWRLPAGFAPRREKTVAPPSGAKGKAAPMLIVMALSGAVSFSLEITWTRLLGHIAGGSIYAFAIMLSTFLFGIAAGAGLIGPFARTPGRALVLLGCAELAIGFLSAATYIVMGDIVPGQRSWPAVLLYAAAIMLPATLCIGATFPLAVRAAARRVDEAPGIAGGLYAANTAGAIVGAIVTGLVLLPWLGFSGVARVTMLTSAAIGLAILVLSREARSPWALPGAVILGLLTLIPFPRPDAIINASSMRTGSTESREVFYAVGRSATVLAKAYGGNINLRTNGLPEASIAMRGAPPARNSQHWLGALPHLARPDAGAFLVVGLGGGVVLEGLPDDADRAVTVVELEREVLNANRIIEAHRRVPIMHRDGVSYVINDARSALLLSKQRYDVIVSQPSHPWTAGASHLYTREFISLARERLKADGVYLQWINSEFLTEPLLRTLAATLLDQFRFVELFHPVPGVLEFIASEREINDAWLPSRLERILGARGEHFRAVGISDPLDVIAARLLDTGGVRALAARAPVNTDNRNRLATASLSRGRGLGTEDLVRIVGQDDAFCNGSPSVQDRLAVSQAFYIHRQWQLSGFVARSADCAQRAQESLQFLASAHALMIRNDRRGALTLLRRARDFEGAEAPASYLAEMLTLSTPADDGEETSAGLPTAARATLAAWKAAQAGDWKTVKARDSELAASSTLDPWFTDAAKLMSEWRIRDAVKRNSEAQLRIALAIIDSALAVQWTDDLLILRIGVASLLKDADLLLGSAQGYLSVIERKLHTSLAVAADPPSLAPLTRKRLKGIGAQLVGMEAQLSEHEARRIQARIAVLLER